MLPSRQFGWILAAILIVALMLRLAAGAWWQSRLPPGKKFGFGDSESYWELGRTIAQGQPFEYGPDHLKIFRTPGYPAVLAPLFLLRDEPPVYWGRVLSAALSTTAALCVAWLGLLLFDESTALLAAAITAVYPEAIALGAFVLSEAPFTTLILLHLLFWILAWRGQNPRTTELKSQTEASAIESKTIAWSLAAGVAGGLATLTRPSWLLFIPFASGTGLVIGPHRRKHAIILAGMLAGLCVTMLPWWIRNYQVAGRFVPTSLQVGASLYDGLSPNATGASDMQFVGAFVAEQRAADAQPGADLRGLFEDRLDRRMRNAAVEWAERNPQRVIQLAAIKFARMWSFVPNASEFQSRWLRLILAASYTPVILLTLAGIWKFARREWPYLLCVLPAVYFTCLHVIFVSSIRYRQPAMLPLIVLAAGMVTEWIRKKRGGPSAV
jgi:4-amino-4-deoxy-L-arabinose transferase-like glycosyltransferase